MPWRTIFRYLLSAALFGLISGALLGYLLFNRRRA